MDAQSTIIHALLNGFEWLWLWFAFRYQKMSTSCYI